MLNYYGLSNIVPVKLDSYVCDLNLEISSDGYSCTPRSEKGFSYMWGGAKANFGVRTGKACYEVKILDYNEISDKDQDAPHVVRLGWSVDRATLQLGEDVCSFGYGGTGMISYNRKFTSYGIKFGKGDVVGCYLAVQDGVIYMAYKVNSNFLGNAFKMRWPSEEPLFPHILVKNCKIEVNFGQMSFPYFTAEAGFQLIAHMSPDALVPSITPPSTQRDCEVIMLVGLPGVGKTTWAINYAKKFPEKNYFVLGTDSIIEKMRVKGLPRKNNFHGRFEVLIKQATECFNVNLSKAANKACNLILDQTNVYATARRRKVAQYRQKGFRVNCVVLVPEDAEMERRSKLRTKEQGKEVPLSALLDMKANFTLPQEDERLFDQITFLELQRPEAQALVEQYNREAESQGHTKKAVKRPSTAAPSQANQYYGSSQKSYDTPQQAPARYPNQSDQARGDFYSQPKQASYDPYSQQMQRASTAQDQSSHYGGDYRENTPRSSNLDYAGAYNDRNSSAAADDYSNSMRNSQPSASGANYAGSNSEARQYDGYNQQQKYMNRGPQEATHQFGARATGTQNMGDSSQRQMGSYQSTHPYPPTTSHTQSNTYQSAGGVGQQRDDWQHSQTTTATVGGNGGAGYNVAQSKADYWNATSGGYDGSKPGQFDQGRGYTEGPGRGAASDDTWNRSSDGQTRYGGNIDRSAENRSHPYPQQGDQGAQNFQGRPPPSDTQQFPTERRGFAPQSSESRAYEDYSTQYDGRPENEGMQDRRQIEPMDIDRYSTSSQRSAISTNFTSGHRPGQDPVKYDEHFSHQAAAPTSSTYNRQPEVANAKAHQAYSQFGYQDNLEGFDRGDGRYNTNSSKYNSYSEQGRSANFRQDYNETNQPNNDQLIGNSMQDRNFYRGPPGQEPIPRGSERGPPNAFGTQNEFARQKERFPRSEFGQHGESGPGNEFLPQGERGTRGQFGPQGEFGSSNNRGARPPLNPGNSQGSRPPLNPGNNQGPRPPFNPANSRGPQGQYGRATEGGPPGQFGPPNERGQRAQFGPPNERGPRAPAPIVQQNPPVSRREPQSNEGPRQVRIEPKSNESERRSRRERSKDRKEPRRSSHRSRSPVRSTTSSLHRRSDDRPNRRRERSGSRSRRDRGDRRRSRSRERSRNGMADSKKSSSNTPSDSKKSSSNTVSAASGSKPEIKAKTDAVSAPKPESSNSTSNVTSGKRDQHSSNSTAAKAVDKEKDVQDKSSTSNAPSSSNPQKADQSKSADKSSHKSQPSDESKSEKSDKAATGHKEAEQKQPTNRDESRNKERTSSSRPRRSRWQAADDTPSNQSSSKQVSPRKPPSFATRDRAERPQQQHPEHTPAIRPLMGARPRPRMGRPLQQKGAPIPRFPAPGPRMHMEGGYGKMPLLPPPAAHHDEFYHEEENYGEEQYYGDDQGGYQDEYADGEMHWEEEPPAHAGWNRPQPRPPMMHPPHGMPRMRTRPAHLRPELRHRMPGGMPRPHFQMRPGVPRMGMRPMAMMRPVRPMFHPHMNHH